MFARILINSKYLQRNIYNSTKICIKYENKYDIRNNPFCTSTLIREAENENKKEGEKMEDEVENKKEEKEPPPPPPLTTEEYNAQMAIFKKKMHIFRKELIEEFRIKKEKKIEDDKKYREEVERLRQEKREKRRKEKEIKKIELDKKLEEAKKKKAEETIEARKRQDLRESLLSNARDERYAYLLQESRKWITREDLDKRIDEAINNAENLY